MKTNKKNTFEVLDSYFLNTESMTMNVDYFLDCINTQIDVTYRSDRKNRKKLISVGIYWLEDDKLYSSFGGCWEAQETI